MFDHTGACHSVADDRELNVLMTVSSTMGPFYYTLAAIRDFVTSKERQREQVACITVISSSNSSPCGEAFCLLSNWQPSIL